MTDEREAVEARRNRRLRALLEVSPDVVVWLSPDGEYIDFHATEDAELSSEESTLIGRTMREVLPAERFDEAVALLQRVAATGEVHRVDYTFPGPNGTVHYEARLLATGPEIIACVRDVSEIVEARRAAEQAARYYEALMTHSFDMIVTTDPDGIITFANRAVTTLLGHDNEQLVGTYIVDLVHPDERAEVIAGVEERLSGRHKGRPVNRRVLDAWGGYLVCEVLADNLLDDPDVGAAVFHARDITTRLEAQQELLERERELADARAARDRAELEGRLRQAQRLESTGRLAAGVAHDFTNLLGVALNYAAVLDRSDLTAAQHEDLEQIRQSAKLAADLAQRLLRFGRADDGHSEAIDLHEVIATMRDLLESTLGRDRKLSTDLHADAPAWIHADRGQIEQVVLNLVLNARDATGVDDSITITVNRIDTNVVLAVTDTGSGMTPFARERAFDPFFTTKPQGMGTGLGLSVVDGIVANSGGAITIDSTENIGTVVTITWPAHTSER